ncbi:MAG TPA: hypothetical protein VGQ81_03530 [Acidobacteriota bacterium]|nr:hypothetical protein [Acidobacteriota bacterium]
MASSDEFFKKYESYEMEAATEFLARYSRTEAELRESIDFLIRHREMMRDVELSRLEAEAHALLDKFNQVKQHKLLEEISCFKDVLSLQKQLLRKNGKPRH